MTTLLRRPRRDPKPTRFLYIANCTVNGTYGLGLEALFAECSAYGQVLDITSEDEKGYVLVTYASIAQAQEAKANLTTIGNRNVIVRYSELYTHSSSSSDNNKGLPECTSVTSHVVVPGLALWENFITPEEEQELIHEIDHDQTWLTTIQRRVQHYGYAFEYDTRDVNLAKPLGKMPRFCQRLLKRLTTGRPDIVPPPNQITINEYIPGQGIAAHVDTVGVFGPTLASLSLASDCVMHFRDSKKTSKNLDLVQRSVCVFTGEARYRWTHGIAHRKFDLVAGHIRKRRRRISITFRQVGCGSAESDVVVGRMKRPTTLEQEHVHQVYDHIASHFHHTRSYPWPVVAAFVKSLPDFSLVADLGCGNFKYHDLNPNIQLVGMDRCGPLLQIARQKHTGCSVLRGDALSLPFRTASFDAALSIAVLHHLETTEHRLALLTEMSRIVKVGGTIFVVAWSLVNAQNELRPMSSNSVHSQASMVSWTLQRAHASPETLDWWNSKNPHEIHDDPMMIYRRYCYLYRREELEQLVNQVPNLRVLQSEYNHTNWCLTISRI